MLIAVLSGFGLAVIAPWLNRIARGATGWIIALLPLGLVIYFATLIGPIVNGKVITESHAWVPTLDINLSFYVDGLSLLFALIITGVGMLIVIYGSGYLAGHPQIGRFYAYLLMFMASMLGVVLADNVITLFIFWELTSVSSFLLIGYYHEKADSRAAALQALLVTGIGGLALLAGLVLMGRVTGTWEISELLNQGEILRNHPLYWLILTLILAGAFTKSAQFPFHFWLPGAMAAPAPVSAYLHSATMVKAGIYLIARLSPALGGTEMWLYTVTGFGTVTMVLAAYIAWQETDLKRILAYSTVSALGTLMMLLGLGDHIAVEAAIVYLIVHSLYKGSLFMVVGAVDHESGTRFITELGGLRRAMPLIAIAAGLAALSMSGIPLFFGFIGKELIYEATLEAHLLSYWAYIITGAAVVANALTIVAAGLVAIKPFFGQQVETPEQPHRAPLSMWLGPMILAGLGLVFGLISSDAIKTALPLNIDDAVSAVVSGILAKSTHVSLHLFPSEISIIVILSVITIAGGVGFYLLRDTLYRFIRPLNIITKWGPERWYDWILDGMMMVARLQTRVLQSGYLRYYLLIIILMTVGLAGTTLVTQSKIGLEIFRQIPNVRVYELFIYITIVAAIVVTVTTSSRLTAVAALGVVGYGMALIFTLFGAPDLAMTQFSIETLSVILLVLVLYKLPRFSVFSSTKQHLRDVIVALAGGSLMTVLILIVTALDSQSRLTPYFAENSLALARGHNVVNVILVDFRGFDTMGEITVLGIAALGVYGLLKLRLEKIHRSDEEQEAQAHQRQSTDHFLQADK